MLISLKISKRPGSFILLYICNFSPWSLGAQDCKTFFQCELDELHFEMSLLLNQ